MNQYSLTWMNNIITFSGWKEADVRKYANEIVVLRIPSLTVTDDMIPEGSTYEDTQDSLFANGLSNYKGNPGRPIIQTKDALVEFSDNLINKGKYKVWKDMLFSDYEETMTRLVIWIKMLCDEDVSYNDAFRLALFTIGTSALIPALVNMAIMDLDTIEKTSSKIQKKLAQQKVVNDSADSTQKEVMASLSGKTEAELKAIADQLEQALGSAKTIP